MPSQPLVLRPGVNVQQTPLLAEATWVTSNWIRFKDGLLQKMGGFSNYINSLYRGVCRGLFAWQDIDGNQYVAIGTNTELDITFAGELVNITPITRTSVLTAPFTLTSGSVDYRVTDSSAGIAVGDSIRVVNKCAVDTADGIIHGIYVVSTTPDPSHYTFVYPTPAVNNVSGGVAVLFTTTATSDFVQATLPGIGNAFIVGDIFTVDLTTTVGGLTLFGIYEVETIVDPDNLTFNAFAPASSSTTAYEGNSNTVTIQYLLTNGLESAISGSGYGNGPYGGGFYSYGVASGAAEPLRQWSFGSWSITSQLIASPTNGAIYEWDPTPGIVNNPAAIIPQAPIYNTCIFIAMPEIQIVALGSEFGGTQDPLLIRWCDSADFTSWIATSDNQAGSYRLPRGSCIVGGTQGPQQGLIWTDLGLWSMSYIQPPFIYGFNEISTGCGLLGAHAYGLLNNRVYWASQNGFFIYDGNSVSSLPCSVWDIIYRNLDVIQKDKVCCSPNSAFNELKFSFPSLSGDGENDMYVKVNLENPNQPVWDYSINGIDTAGFDQSVIGPPIGAHNDTKTVVQYETQDGTNGTINSWAQSGWFKIAEGEVYLFIERMLPDFKFTNPASTLEITVFFVDYPMDTPRPKGPFTITPTTEWIIVRGRGRLASVYIEDNFGNYFWRLGEPLYFGAPAGRR